MATPHAAEERHATWLELFFDLVIVAAVAQLAHLLHDGVDVERVYIFGVAYYAMWSVRYWLWGIGIVLDVVTSVLRSRRPTDPLVTEHRGRERAMLSWEGGRLRRVMRPVVEVHAAAPDRPHLCERTRIVLCAGAALYFLTATVIGARGGATWRWVVGWGIPSVVVCALAGAFGAVLPGWALLAVITAAAVWHIAYRRVSGAVEMAV